MVNIPRWLQNQLDVSRLEKIEAAVASAEKRTSGEIVPVVVRRSSTIGHVPMIAFLLLVVLFFAFDVLHLQEPFLGDSLFWLIPELGGLFGLALLGSRLDGVQRLLTPDADEAQQVALRAEVEFFENGLNQTRESTGVLLMASMMEHRAVVLADRSIAEKLPPETWNEVVQLMIEGLKRRDLASGFEAAIQRCGELLEPHFPIQPDDQNELRNHLVIKD